MYRQLRALQQISRRTISSSVVRQSGNKVPEKQKMYQENDGVPVHLKGGSSDQVLYRITMALTVIGTGYVLFELVSAALPKKK